MKILICICDKRQSRITTGRVFACTTDATRHFIVGEDTVGSKLWFGDDLAAITSVVNDADGTPTTLVNGTDYLPIPRDKTPYSGLRLLGSSSAFWDYTNDPETGVTVTGKWAYSTTPPDDIEHACTLTITVLR